MFNRLISFETPVFPNPITDLRIQFRVEKSAAGYPQLAEFSIYNLNSNHRQLIEQEGIQIYYYVGYEDVGTSLLFEGKTRNVVHEYIKPDWITKIYAYNASSAINNSTINKTMPAGTTAEELVDELVKKMTGVTKGLTTGLLSSSNESLAHKILESIRANSLSGTLKLLWADLSKKFSFDYVIDNNVIDIVPKNKPALDLPSIIINQASGMIGSPERTEIGVNVKTLLNPQAKLLRRFSIESTSTKISIGNQFYTKIPPVRNQGIYRINKLIHDGDTHADNWFTHFFGRNF